MNKAQKVDNLVHKYYELENRFHNLKNKTFYCKVDEKVFNAVGEVILGIEKDFHNMNPTTYTPHYHLDYLLDYLDRFDEDFITYSEDTQ